MHIKFLALIFIGLALLGVTTAGLLDQGMYLLINFNYFSKHIFICIIVLIVNVREDTNWTENCCEKAGGRFQCWSML